MTLLTPDLAALLRRDLHAFIREVETCPDDAALWRPAPGFPNSVGNLALHVAGNLRHFVGGVLGRSGYVRNRELEFSQRQGSRAEVRAQLEAALAELEPGLARLDAAALAAPYPLAVAGVQLPTGRFLLHLATHLAFHLGQAGALRRVLTGGPALAGAMGLDALAP